MKPAILIIFICAIGFNTIAYSKMPFEQVSFRNYPFRGDARILDYLQTKDNSYHIRGYYFDDNSNPNDYFPFEYSHYSPQDEKFTTLFRSRGLTFDDHDVFFEVGADTYFKVDGNLYVSDGTKEGTKQLKDFGLFDCCGNYDTQRSAFDFITSIGNILYFRVVPESSYNDGNSASQYTLWQSDGTREGTKSISGITHDEAIGYVSHSDKLGSGYIRYVADNKLWASDKNSAPVVLYSFPDEKPVDVYRWLDSNDYSITEQGFFICPGIRDAGLWKIAKDDTVTKLAASCEEILSGNNGDDLSESGFYYLSDDGDLWFTEGGYEGEIIYSATSRWGSYSGVCMVGQSFYFEEDDKFIEIDSENAAKDITSRLRATKAARRFLVGCSNEGIVVGYNFENEWEYLPTKYNFYSLENETVHSIGNFDRSVSEQQATKQLRGDAVFVTGGSYSLYFLQQSFAFLPPILDVLIQDESGTQ